MIAESNSSVVLSPVTQKYDLFASLVKRLSFLITPDTSAVHLASAFKICAVVLYVQSNKDLRIWEPYGTDYETIVTDTDDLSSISVENVESALKNIIERHRKIIN
jgi:ADP-heptose:LPS heptosyltransferase